MCQDAWKFNQALSWDISRVTYRPNMKAMFANWEGGGQLSGHNKDLIRCAWRGSYVFMYYYGPGGYHAHSGKWSNSMPTQEWCSNNYSP